MNGFTSADDLFKFVDEEEDESVSSSSAIKRKMTKSWAETIQEKRRDFTPTLSNRNSPPIPKDHLKSGGDKSKWVGYPNPSFDCSAEDETLIDSPSKYQAIECDESSSESDQDSRNAMFVQSRRKSGSAFTKTSSGGGYPSRAKRGPSISTPSCNTSKSFKLSKPKRLAVTPKRSTEDEQVDIEVIKSPVLKHCPTNKPLKHHSIILRKVVPYRKVAPSPTLEMDRTVVPNSDEEDVLELEHTIIELESPVKSSPKKNSRNNPSVRVLDSQPCSSDASQHISQDPSTPSSGTSALLDRTPIAQWIQKGKTDADSIDLDISEFESPKKIGKPLAYTEFNSEQWTVVAGRRRKKHGLADKMRGMVARYESSVRMFSHDLRNGKFNEDLATALVIRSICGREDRLVWTICYDINGHDNRCVIFKPQYPQEITPGATLKLYKPWKEINVPGMIAPVIICADFYKIIQKPEDLRLHISEEFLKRLKSTPLLYNRNNFRMIPADELKHTFLHLVPYGVTNRATVTAQAARFKSSIDLDIVIQTMWPSESGYIILIKDSDEVFSVLDAPDSNEELQQVLSPGRYIRFKKLGINSKITLFKDSSLFSVLRVYGSKQMFYYNLGLRLDTEWNFELDLEIPFGRMDCQRRFIHEIQQIGGFENERVAVECEVDKKTRNWISIIDKAGCRMKVHLLSSYESSKQIFSSLMPLNKHVVLNFLRVVNDKLMLDRFSIVEEWRPPEVERRSHFE